MRNRKDGHFSGYMLIIQTDLARAWMRISGGTYLQGKGRLDWKWFES